MIVDIDESELHCLLLLCVIIVEFHLSQQQLSIVVVFHFKISSLWHKSNYLRWVVSGFVGLIYSQRSPVCIERGIRKWRALEATDFEACLG